MSRLPSVHGGGGHAISHAPKSERCVVAFIRGTAWCRTHSRHADHCRDIRPWIQAGEAARPVLANIEIAEPIE